MAGGGGGGSGGAVAAAVAAGGVGMAGSVVPMGGGSVVSRSIMSSASTVMGSDFGSSGSTMSRVGLRASGGPVIAGSPYVVGEEGPEMFVPSVSGTIISNDAMGGWSRASGGGSVNVQTLNIYGVQDVGAMFTSVLREARARGVAIG